MYVQNFRNPVLFKSMHKVFWMFPSIDDTEQWQRLTPEVKKFTKWLFKPTKHENEPYKSIIGD